MPRRPECSGLEWGMAWTQKPLNIQHIQTPSWGCQKRDNRVREFKEKLKRRGAQHTRSWMGRNQTAERAPDMKHRTPNTGWKSRPEEADPAFH